MTSRCRVVQRPRHAPRRAGRGALLVALLALAPVISRAAAEDPAAAADTLSGVADAPATPDSAIAITRAGWIRADRLQHASLALAVGVGIGLSSREPAAGAGAAVTLAIAKELMDDRFDRGDLAAGVAGAALAWLVVAALTR